MEIKTKKSILEHSNPYFSVLKNELELKKDNEILDKDYYTIQSKDFIVVLAQKEDFILMTKQYRYSVSKFSEEFVGGFLNDNEKPQDAAKRELQEETGYVSDKLYLLGKITPLTSKCSNMGYIYYTDEVQFIKKDLEKWEEFVDLTSSWVKIKDIRRKILDGNIFDATTLAAWTLFRETIKI